MFYWGVFHIYFFFFLFLIFINDKDKSRNVWSLTVSCLFVFGLHKAIDSYDSLRTLNKFLKSTDIINFLKVFLLRDDYFYGLCVGFFSFLVIISAVYIIVVVLNFFGIIDASELLE